MLHYWAEKMKIGISRLIVLYPKLGFNMAVALSMLSVSSESCLVSKGFKHIESNSELWLPSQVCGLDPLYKCGASWGGSLFSFPSSGLFQGSMFPLMMLTTLGSGCTIHCSSPCPQAPVWWTGMKSAHRHVCWNMTTSLFLCPQSLSCLPTYCWCCYL